MQRFAQRLAASQTAAGWPALAGINNKSCRHTVPNASPQAIWGIAQKTFNDQASPRGVSGIDRGQRLTRGGSEGTCIAEMAARCFQYAWRSPAADQSVCVGAILQGGPVPRLDQRMNGSMNMKHNPWDRLQGLMVGVLQSRVTSMKGKVSAQRPTGRGAADLDKWVATARAPKARYTGAISRPGPTLLRLFATKSMKRMDQVNRHRPARGQVFSARRTFIAFPPLDMQHCAPKVRPSVLPAGSVAGAVIYPIGQQIFAGWTAPSGEDNWPAAPIARRVGDGISHSG